ncbi:slit homolog 3 protein-like [Cotesia glomerata]|uniref:slit homolog 3 protein-like n=1 Tax=Cotesia glomerata TaxID=32391 RepID=UPI001D017156|nr:slit homolog 3 protein-like [Cotesia glomerata]
MVGHNVLFLLISWSVSIHCGILKLDQSSVNNNLTIKDESVLDFSNSGLIRLKKSFLNSSVITHLFLTDNDILEIEEGAFDSLPNLVYLNLTGNLIPFDELNFGNESKIEVLVLDNAIMNPVHNPNITLSNQCNRVHFFRTISSNQGNTIILKSQMKLSNLKKLYLRNNNIESIDGVSIVMLKELMPNISHLILEHNRISSVSFIKFLPSTVTDLLLSDNKISKFESVSLNHLKTLEISDNKIKNLCGTYGNCDGMTLKSAANLEVLLMSNVQLQNIESNSFEDLGNLLLLDLSRNQIGDIAKHTFDDLTNLMTLRLDHNKLDSIPDVCGLKNLESFSLAHNKIKIIDDSMSCLSKVKELNLSNNILDEINSEAFSSFAELEKLDLSSNKLVILPDNWIPLTSNLQHLDLHSNLFTSLASMSLTKAENLKYLSIGSNPLKAINIKILKTLPESTTVDVEKIGCDQCQICEKCQKCVEPEDLGSSDHCRSCGSYCSNCNYYQEVSNDYE